MLMQVRENEDVVMVATAVMESQIWPAPAAMPVVFWAIGISFSTTFHGDFWCFFALSTMS
jgi:hypothetical protein